MEKRKFYYFTDFIILFFHRLEAPMVIAAIEKVIIREFFSFNIFQISVFYNYNPNPWKGIHVFTLMSAESSQSQRSRFRTKGVKGPKRIGHKGQDNLFFV